MYHGRQVEIHPRMKIGFQQKIINTNDGDASNDTIVTKLRENKYGQVDHGLGEPNEPSECGKPTNNLLTIKVTEENNYGRENHGLGEPNEPAECGKPTNNLLTIKVTEENNYGRENHDLGEPNEPAGCGKSTND